MESHRYIEPSVRSQVLLGTWSGIVDGNVGLVRLPDLKGGGLFDLYSDRGYIVMERFHRCNRLRVQQKYRSHLHVFEFLGLQSQSMDGLMGT